MDKKGKVIIDHPAETLQSQYASDQLLELLEVIYQDSIDNSVFPII